jgi:hypothetical protein
VSFWRPRSEFLQRVRAVCAKHPGLTKRARKAVPPSKPPSKPPFSVIFYRPRYGDRSLEILMDVIHPRPNCAKHGSRRIKKWQRDEPHYRAALEWWLQQDVITQLGALAP